MESGKNQKLVWLFALLLLVPVVYRDNPVKHIKVLLNCQLDFGPFSLRSLVLVMSLYAISSFDFTFDIVRQVRTQFDLVISRREQKLFDNLTRDSNNLRAIVAFYKPSSDKLRSLKNPWESWEKFFPVPVLMCNPPHIKSDILSFL